MLFPKTFCVVSLTVMVTAISLARLSFVLIFHGQCRTVGTLSRIDRASGNSSGRYALRQLIYMAVLWGLVICSVAAFF